MERFKVGDVVVRKSHDGDIYFKVVQIVKNKDGQVVYILKGINLRLMADSPEADLEAPGLNRVNDAEENYNKKVNSIMRKIMMHRKKGVPLGKAPILPKTKDTILPGRAGKVLHVDGDEEYLNICIRGYKQLGMDVVGKSVPEVRQPEVILELLNEHRPDILVLTGHDGMIKGTHNFRSVDSYRNSRFFIESVKKARTFESSYDDLVIFAGACQSFYEGIIDAGANFASSPHRVLIHALDPIFLCEKIAFGSISKFFTIQEALENTITGDKGIGGFQTRGKFREGTPKSPYA